jgi:hypothetical protein
MFWRERAEDRNRVFFVRLHVWWLAMNRGLSNVFVCYSISFRLFVRKY